MTYHRKGKAPPSHYVKIATVQATDGPWDVWLRPTDHKGQTTIKVTAAGLVDGPANYWILLAFGRLGPWSRMSITELRPDLFALVEGVVASPAFQDAKDRLNSGPAAPRGARPKGTKLPDNYERLGEGELAAGWTVYVRTDSPDPLHWANLMLWGPSYSYRVGWGLAEQRLATTSQSIDLTKRHPEVVTELVKYMRELRNGR